MNRWIYDIEVMPNFFCVVAKNYDTEEIKLFEISERMDDRVELLKLVKSVDYLVGFNNIHYDCPHIIALIKEKSFTNLDLYNLTETIIHGEYVDWKQYKYYPREYKLQQIDLFLYWSKMLRQSKMLSLKSLAVQLNFHNIQELPIKPGTKLTHQQMDDVKKYCVNDVEVTYMLAKRMSDDINLRSYITKEYGVNSMSYDAPKIASEILADYYACAIKTTAREVKKLSYHKPHAIHIGNLISDVVFNFKLPVFKELYNRICNSITTFSDKMLIKEGNTLMMSSLGVGGIHSVNKNEIYKANKDKVIITSDIASLYPTLYLNYGCIRYPEILDKLTQIKEERLIAKKNKDKAKDTFLKLCLNSVSGLLDNTYSWLYYPEGALRMRILGQLILTKLTEEAILIGGKVVSQNTDGIEIIFDKHQLKDYYFAVANIEQQYNVIFEHDFYKKIVYSSVNDYIAITESGKLKKKGLFVTNPVLGNSTDFLIIPKALETYFVNGIQPEKFIKEHNNIFDFTAAKKIAKSYTVIWMNEIQQQLNRYYVSKKGGFLYKQKKDKNQENVLKGYGVMLYNKHEDKPMEDYHIDYQYYISKVREIINDLEPKQMTLF